MRPATIAKAVAALPATREELAARLGVGDGQARNIARYLIKHRHAEQWGDKLNDRGGLSPILRAVNNGATLQPPQLE